MFCAEDREESMNLRDARLVVAGQLLVGPRVGITTPTKVLEVMTYSTSPQARLPLFVMEGERFPITYSLLNRVGERNDQ